MLANEDQVVGRRLLVVELDAEAAGRIEAAIAVLAGQD